LWGDCTPLASSEDFKSVTTWTGRRTTTQAHCEAYLGSSAASLMRNVID
jgi:hypothetical protein